jgi:hypothetical protein
LNPSLLPGGIASECVGRSEDLVLLSESVLRLRSSDGAIAPVSDLLGAFEDTGPSHLVSAGRLHGFEAMVIPKWKVQINGECGMGPQGSRAVKSKK